MAVRRRKKVLFWAAAGFALALLFLPSLARTVHEVRTKQRELLLLHKKEAALKRENAQLKKTMKSLHGKEELEKLARDMGYVRPGEKAFRIIGEAGEKKK